MKIPNRDLDRIAEHIEQMRKIRRTGDKTCLKLAGLRKLSEPAYKYCMSVGRPWQESVYRLLYEVEDTCIECGNFTAFHGIFNGYREHCSRRCANTNAEALALNSRRVAEAFAKIPEAEKRKTVERRKNTMLQRYGVEQTAQSKELYRKMQTTHKLRYGTTCIFYDKGFQKKARQRFQINKEEYIKRKNNTMLQRYGVEHYAQLREGNARAMQSRYGWKTIEVGNKVFVVQGYEDYAISFLIEQMHVAPKDIKVSAADGCPSVPWVDSAGMKHIYHPDMYAKVKGRWWLIEVKSTYTAGLTLPKPGLFSVMRKKIEACEKAGFRTKVLVVDPARGRKKLKIHVVGNVHLKSRKEVKELIAQK